MVSFSNFTDGKISMSNYFLNRKQGLRNFIQTLCSVMDFANGIPTSYMSLELYLPYHYQKDPGLSGKDNVLSFTTQPLFGDAWVLQVLFEA